MNGTEFLAYCDRHREELERQMYEEDDLMINGDGNWQREVGEVLEKGFLGSGMRGIMACMAD